MQTELKLHKKPKRNPIRDVDFSLHTDAIGNVHYPRMVYDSAIANYLHTEKVYNKRASKEAKKGHEIFR